MEKKAKIIVTREQIDKDLREDVKWCIDLYRSMCIFMGIFFIPLFVYFFWSFVTSDYIIVIKIALCFLSTICLFPFLGDVYKLCKSFAERKKILNGDYEITTRKMMYRSEREHRTTMLRYLHFDDFKGKSVDEGDFKLAFLGEEYYIVHLKDSKEIKKLYSTERYEIKDYAR